VVTVKAYLDSSAAVKLIHNEFESASVRSLTTHADIELISSYLLETELRRSASRLSVEQATVTAVLDAITLYPIEPTDYTVAGLLPGDHLRSLDALHVQTAHVLAAHCVVTYDDRMIDACHSVGLRVLQP
jgi:predicted nucleic acid-binding protein